MPSFSSLSGQAKYIFFTILTPLFTLYLGSQVVKPDWQEWTWRSYIGLFLSDKVNYFFLPFLAFSIISMLLLVVNFKRFHASPTIKFGILSGLLLAVKFTLLGALWFGLMGSYYALIFVLGFLLLPAIFSYSRRLSKLWPFVIVLLFVLVTTQWFFHFSSNIVGMTSAFLFFFTFSPANTVVFAYFALKQLQPIRPLSRFSLPYLAAYSTALYLAIQKTISEYALLPKSPPGCFIVTAAAQGHPGLTGSWTSTSYPTLRINHQLQTFKLFEYILKNISPTLWHIARSIYNQVGYSTAKHINSYFKADIIYILLKPGEWAILLLCHLILPNYHQLRSQLFK